MESLQWREHRALFRRVRSRTAGGCLFEPKCAVGGGTEVSASRAARFHWNSGDDILLVRPLLVGLKHEEVAAPGAPLRTCAACIGQGATDQAGMLSRAIARARIAHRRSQCGEIRGIPHIGVGCLILNLGGVYRS